MMCRGQGLGLKDSCKNAQHDTAAVLFWHFVLVTSSEDAGEPEAVGPEIVSHIAQTGCGTREENRHKGPIKAMLGTPQTHCDMLQSLELGRRWAAPLPALSCTDPKMPWGT